MEAESAQVRAEEVDTSSLECLPGGFCCELEEAGGLGQVLCSGLTLSIECSGLGSWNVLGGSTCFYLTNTLLAKQRCCIG